MVGDCLTNQQSKTNSAEGHISTSESTHSKNTNRLPEDRGAAISKKECTQSVGYKLPQNAEFLQQEDKEETENRLFTFMDERDCQKKIIQNFLAKQTLSHLCLSHPQQENNASLLNMANLAIEKIIEGSKKKREDCDKKILNVINVNRSSKSASKLIKMNKSKTARAKPRGEQKYETLQPKSRSKTPKFQQHRSITPKYTKEVKLFRAKSNLEKDWVHINCLGKLKKQIKLTEIKKQRYELDENGYIEEEAGIKALLRKKKELQRQLQAVNETLTTHKRKPLPQGNSTPRPKKPPHTKTHKNRKKSILKLTKYQ